MIWYRHGIGVFEQLSLWFQHSSVKNDCLSASFLMNARVAVYLFHLDELVAVFCGKDMDTC